MAEFASVVGVAAMPTARIDGRNEPTSGAREADSIQEEKIGYTGLAAFAVELVINEGQLMTHVEFVLGTKETPGGTMSKAL